ncbi:MAG: TonB-dependent receptor [Bacteroidota bacterium]
MGDASPTDFGNTLNYKLAARYKIIEDFSLRASVSSGFRAPSLAQIHYNLLFNNIVAGRSVRTLLASNTSTVTKGFGIESLNQEKAVNLAAGFTYKKGGFTATVDAYQISVTDRIVLTDIFDASDLEVGADAAEFFANDVDTKTTGIDVVVLSYKKYLDGGNAFNAGVAANFNNTEIENINSRKLNEFTFFGPFSQAYLEADALFAVATNIYEGAGTLDISIGYEFNDQLKLTVSANNLLNIYPTLQFDGWTDQGGFNDSVQMGSDGQFLFTRLGFRF